VSAVVLGLGFCYVAEQATLGRISCRPRHGDERQQSLDGFFSINHAFQL
jgi:hypothetical protein